jgi:predicted dehydrogenase
VKSIVCFSLRWNPSMQNTKAMLDRGHDRQAVLRRGRLLARDEEVVPAVPWSVKKPQGGSLAAVGRLPRHRRDALVRGTEQRRRRGDGVQRRAQGHNTDWGYDPTTVLICKFKDGTIGKVRQHPRLRDAYQFNIDIAGTKGTIRDNRVWSEALMARPDRLGDRAEHHAGQRRRRTHHPSRHRWKRSRRGSRTASRSAPTSTDA